MSDRFNPIPGQDYGLCETCQVGMPTPEDARVHMDATLEASPRSSTGSRRGHAIRVTNPTRAQRIESKVESEVDTVVEECLDRLDGLVARGEATEEEIQAALRHHGPFHETWTDEWMGAER